MGSLLKCCFGTPKNTEPEVPERLRETEEETMNYHSQLRHSASENAQFPIRPVIAREPSRSVVAPIRTEQWFSRPMMDAHDTQGDGLYQSRAKKRHRSCNFKNAVEHYQSGNYLAAMRLCKTLLATNSSDYQAQLLLGCSLASYKMIPSAEETFRAAVKIDERDYRGWTGLSSILELNGAKTVELFDIYLTILTFARPDTREEWNHVFEKALMLHLDLGGNHTMNLKLGNLRDFAGYPHFDDNAMSKWRDLIYFSPTKSNVDEIVMKAACSLVKDSPYSGKLDRMKCEILYSITCKERWTEVEAQCLRMHKVFPSEKLPLKILANHYIKTDMGCVNDKIKQIYQNLFKTDQQSALAAIGFGQSQLSEKKYTSAITWLKKGLAQDEHNVHGWLYLAQAQLATKHMKEAHASSLKGLELLEDKPSNTSTNSVRSQLELCRDQSAGTRSSFAKNSSIISPRSQVELIPPQTPVQTDPNLAIIATLVESIPLQSLKKATPTDLYKKLIQVCKRIHGQRHRDPQTLSDWRRGSRAEYNLQHARNYWENSMETITDPWMFLTSILKAIKQDPWNAEVFLLLGKYICEILAEMRLGHEFVELAYNLQPDDDVTGSYLVDIYMILQEREKAIQILASCLNKTPDAKWTWLRLGLIEMNGRNYNQAESYFWNAINGDRISNRQPYECLGRNRLRMGYLQYHDSLAAFAAGAKLQPQFMSSAFNADVTSLEAVDLRAIYNDTNEWMANPQATGVQFAFSLLYAIFPELLRPIGYNFNSIAKARKAITSVYKNGGLLRTGQRIDWGEADKQCAYMVRFFLIHCQFVPWLLRCTPNILTKFPAGNHLRVCCVGGGPGSDIVGLITFLRSINRNTRLTCHILDKFPDWNKVWKTIQPRLPPPAVNASYLPLDITSSAPLDRQTVDAIRDADIVTFVKSVSPAVAFLKNPPVLNQQYPFMPIQSQRGAIPTILQTLKSGTLVVYIDNQYGDQNPLFHNMAVSSGLRLLNKKVWKCDIEDYAAEYNAVWNGHNCQACLSCSVHGYIFYKP